MENNIVEIALCNKSCENCGSSKIERLWEYKHIAKSSTKKWIFSVNNCICEVCGFVFVSPSYSDKSLSEYYDDAKISFKIDYSIDKRLSVIYRHKVKKGTYLELGTKQKTKFHDLLKGFFSEVLTQSIENASDCDFNEMQSVANESVDVLAHYFVLEHVPQVKAFLLSCWKVLKRGGVMIIEVPDLNKYPHDIAALMLYEHTNHFSIEILEQLCSQIGFELISKDFKNASRSFGMIAVFRKVEHQSDILFSKETYLSNKKSFITGVGKANQYSEFLERTRQDIANSIQSNNKIIVWGANDICDSLFLDPRLLDYVVLIDSDPSKIHYFENKIVKTPQMAFREIMDADEIIICSGRWSREILETIKGKFDKEFKLENIKIIDYCFY